MIVTQEAPTRSVARMSSCSICGKSVRVNPLKANDTDVICRLCRCKRCSIPISSRPCDRCGVAHGTPSSEPGLCELCFSSSAEHSDTLSADVHWTVVEEHAGTIS